MMDLRAGDDSGRLAFGQVFAPAGHSSALPFATAPADHSEFAGYGLGPEGAATKSGKCASCTLMSTDTIAYAIGKYIGGVRLGFVTASEWAEAEATFHQDHPF